MTKRTFNRRDILKNVAGGAFGVSLLGSSHLNASVKRINFPPYRKRLSSPHSSLKEYYDKIVVGSGYGASIMAARLAEGSSETIAIFERGSEKIPGDFPDTLSDIAQEAMTRSNPLGLFDINLGPDIDVISGNGLGGTSLINCAAIVEPNPEIFDQKAWPQEIRDEAKENGLKPYINKVKLELKSKPYPNNFPKLAKTKYQHSASRKLRNIGVDAQFKLLDLAISFKDQQDGNHRNISQKHCSLCGDCPTGCNIGAKNSLDVNYLPYAKSNGAEIFTESEIHYFEKGNDELYHVHIRLLAKNGIKKIITIKCKELYLGAGSLGSTQIMLKSQKYGNLKFSNKLGTSFSGNGDILGIGYSTKAQLNTMGYGNSRANRSPVGPTITSGIYFNQNKNFKDQFIVEEGAFPSAVTSILRKSLQSLGGFPNSFADNNRRTRDFLVESEKGALNHSTLFLGIGHDDANGKIKLKRNDKVEVSWPYENRKPYYQKTYKAMKKITSVGDGSFIKNPRHSIWAGNNLVTVHPIGGCPMGENKHSGVVNHIGQVFNNRSNDIFEGLFIVDGSILPTSVGSNMLLTVSLIAERIAAHINN